jgi:hypothetical protein
MSTVDKAFEAATKREKAADAKKVGMADCRAAKSRRDLSGGF